MEHTGTQLRIAASGPGAQRVIGLTDQTDNFYTIAGTLGLATSPDEQNALSKDGTVKVARTQAGKVATVAIQAPAAGSADKKPGADKNGVIASGKVPDDSAVSGPLGATGTAVMAIAIAAVMLVAIAMLIKAARNARNN